MRCQGIPGLEPFHGLQAWSGRTTYLLASVGSAVGLGNIWRFPYLVYRNGGACFLIPYALSMFLLGIPLFVLETSLGQGSRKGAFGAFKDLGAKCAGLGWMCLVSTSGIVTYYCVVLAWILQYLVGAVTSSGLPWDSEGASHYFQQSVLQRTFQCSLNPISNATITPQRFCEIRGVVSYSERNELVDLGCSCESTGFQDQSEIRGRTALSLLAVWSVVTMMCVLGTRSLRWGVYVTVPLPYVMLGCLFVRAVTLKGAATGISYYLKPDLTRLFNDYVDPSSGEILKASDVWIQAATQIFFSLSLALGAMVSYASYNLPTFPVTANSVIVVLTNCGTEFLAGFCIFSILGYLAETRGEPIESVAAGGPGLVFEVIPEALSLMPAAKVFSILFFCMLLMLGLSSAVSLAQAVIAIVRDQIKENSQAYPSIHFLLYQGWVVPCICCSVLMSFGLLMCRSSGLEWVDLVDTFISNFLLTLTGTGEFVVVAWVFGCANFNTLMKARIDWQANSVLQFLWKYVGPAVLGTLLVTGAISTAMHPVTSVGWASAVGWSLVIVPCTILLGYALFASDDFRGSAPACRCLGTTTRASVLVGTGSDLHDLT